MCSQCGESYTTIEVGKVWDEETANINTVENPKNKDKFIGGYCTVCGCHWDSWDVNDTPEKIEYLKCKDVKCPDNRKGYCSLGIKPLHLVLTKDYKVKIIKNNH